MRHESAKLALASLCLWLALGVQAAPDASRTASQDGIRVKGLLEAAGVPCTVTATVKLGGAAAIVNAGKRGKAAQPAAPDRYESSCQEGLGYLVTAAPNRDSRPAASFCFEPSVQSPPTTCILPGNHAEAQRNAIVALLARTGNSGCELDRFRLAGRSVAQTYFEIACRHADGLVLATSNPFDPAKRLEAVPCRSVPEASDYACRLADPEAAIEAMTAAAESMFSRESGRIDCKVHGRRHMLTDARGNGWFEFMCQDGAGYIMARLANGKFGGSDTCSAAVVSDLGGCRLPQPSASGRK